MVEKQARLSPKISGQGALCQSEPFMLPLPPSGQLEKPQALGTPFFKDRDPSERVVENSATTKNHSCRRETNLFPTHFLFSFFFLRIFFIYNAYFLLIFILCVHVLPACLYEHYLCVVPGEDCEHTRTYSPVALLYSSPTPPDPTI